MAINLSTSLEPVDQPFRAPYQAAGVSDLSATNMTTKSSNVYVFTSAVTVPFRGQTLSFRNGVPYVLDAPLVTYLAGIGVTISKLS